MASMKCWSAATGGNEPAAAAATSPGNGAGTDAAASAASARTPAASTSAAGAASRLGAGAEDEKLRRVGPARWSEKGRKPRVWAALERCWSGA